VCSRSRAGIALAKAVEAAGLVLRVNMAAEKQALLERDEDSEKVVTDGLGNGKLVLMRSSPTEREAKALNWAEGDLTDQLVTLNQNNCRSQEFLARSQKMQEELHGLLTAEIQPADQLDEALRLEKEKSLPRTSVTEIVLLGANQVCASVLVAPRPSFSDIVTQQQRGMTKLIPRTDAF
jgi:hypothetical protein